MKQSLRPFLAIALMTLSLLGAGLRSKASATTADDLDEA